MWWVGAVLVGWIAANALIEDWRRRRMTPAELAAAEREDAEAYADEVIW